MNKIKKISITLVLLCSTSFFAQTNFYVAPSGNDASQGTKSTKPERSEEMGGI